MMLRSFCTSLLLATTLCAAAQDAPALRARHEAMREALATSPFGRPLLLQSSAGSDTPQGDAYAVLPHPFATVSAALQRAGHWCDLLVLQANMKRCTSEGQRLQLVVGRKVEQPVEDAFQLDFDFSVRAAQPGYLQVQMAAAKGPMGTRDYRLVMEAVPLGSPQDGQTFVHMSYAYATGFAARLATDAYLATAGRNKVGFSITGRDAGGKPVYVEGIRGIAERNTMRYFLAIEAYLDALALPPPQQAEGRLQRWFAATERYPRQLREMTLDEYLSMKRRELNLVRAQG